MELPLPVAQLLLDNVLGDRRHAWVMLDSGGVVLGRGGDLAWFGAEAATVGAPVTDQIEALLAATGEDPTVLPRIELVEGRSADVHAGRTSDGSFLLFVDATPEAVREQRFQQRGNELGLTLRSLGVCLFEQLPSGKFRRLGPRPVWMRALCRDEDDDDPTLGLPFLDNFLKDAEAVWRQRARNPIWSGMWVEQDAGGREWHLEASAVLLEDGRRILVVQSAERQYEERRSILQQARDHSLDFERLNREIDKKEALLHCIVHDLLNPLTSMVGSMSLLHGRELAPDRSQELLELGLEQARHQETMIRSIVEAFRADVDSMESFESEASRAPDLRESVEKAVRAYEPAFRERELVLSLRFEVDGACPVVGEAARLHRVVCNLLENARRFSPTRGRVDVSVARTADGYRILVQDEGPGVPPELVDSLFQRFQQGRSKGVAGLGLFFCRATLEKWGGKIGYRPTDAGGAGFWFELPAAR